MQIGKKYQVSLNLTILLQLIKTKHKYMYIFNLQVDL